MHAIAIKKWLKESKFILIVSILISFAVTSLSLLRVQQNMSPIPEIIRNGRGYPLIFLINTTRSLFGTHLGISVNTLNLSIDVMVWTLIAFITIITMRVIFARQPRN